MRSDGALERFYNSLARRKSFFISAAASSQVNGHYNFTPLEGYRFAVVAIHLYFDDVRVRVGNGHVVGIAYFLVNVFVVAVPVLSAANGQYSQQLYRIVSDQTVLAQAAVNVQRGETATQVRTTSRSKGHF